MKSRKKEINNAHPTKFVLSVMLCLVIVAIAAVTVLMFAKQSKETTSFEQISGDMQLLLTDFNKIDSGWEYSEGCRGKGGDYDRNVPSSCYVSLSNDKETRTGLDFEIDKYRAELQDFDKFTNFSPSVTSYGITEFSFEYQRQQSIKCSFQVPNIANDSTANTASLGCTGYATKFHFPRNDI